jgi:hypothetical protein
MVTCVFRSKTRFVQHQVAPNPHWLQETSICAPKDRSPKLLQKMSLQSMRVRQCDKCDKCIIYATIAMLHAFGRFHPTVLKNVVLESVQILASRMKCIAFLTVGFQ